MESCFCSIPVLIKRPINERTKTTFALLVCVCLDNYVHRLVASKTDGKIVQYECEGDTCDAEKIDALQLEVKRNCPQVVALLQHGDDLVRYLRPQYSYLLTSQLESQRIYWENKIAHLEKEVAEEVCRQPGCLLCCPRRCNTRLMCRSAHQVNNMKSKFKETLERCDTLEQRVSEITKEKQSLEKK